MHSRFMLITNPDVFSSKCANILAYSCVCWFCRLEVPRRNLHQFLIFPSIFNDGFYLCRQVGKNAFCRTGMSKGKKSGFAFWSVASIVRKIKFKVLQFRKSALSCEFHHSLPKLYLKFVIKLFLAKRFACDSIEWFDLETIEWFVYSLWISQYGLEPQEMS